MLSYNVKNHHEAKRWILFGSENILELLKSHLSPMCQVSGLSLTACLLTVMSSLESNFFLNCPSW